MTLKPREFAENSRGFLYGMFLYEIAASLRSSQ